MINLTDLNSKLTALTAVENLVKANNCSYKDAVEHYKVSIEVQVKAQKVEK